MPKIGHPTVPDGVPVRSVKRPIAERGVPPVPFLTNRGPAGLNFKTQKVGPFAPPKTTVVEVSAGRKNRVSEDLRHLVVAIDTLTPDPVNARLHPERNLDAIKDSLNLYGQVKPLVVRRSTRVVMAGNGTLEAMRALGWTKAAASFVDFDEVQAAGYGLADNRTAELARWDFEVVARLDNLLHEANHATVGWTIDELEVLRATDWVPPDRFGDHDDDFPLRKVFTDERIVEEAFHYFRRKGFPYPRLPVYVCLQHVNTLANTASSKLPSTNTGSQVADTYHPHRFHVLADGATYSPFETFSDDDRLRVALEKSMRFDGKITRFPMGLRLSQGTQQASNFRPGYALSMYRRFAPLGSTVLDTSTGYGGRLVGFIASTAGKYVGVDPSAETCDGNRRMVSDFQVAAKVELHQLPAEDVRHEVVKGRCDFAFTSPPYFAKERYSDEPSQSWKRYDTFDRWVAGFLKPMLRLQYAALKSGCVAILNVDDVKVGGKSYPLTETTVKVAEAVGFVLEGREEYGVHYAVGAGREDAVPKEPVLIFRKPLEA